MKWLLLAAGLLLGAAAWFLLNPVKGFGLSRPGLATYDMIPIPWADFQVRPDGTLRRVPKTHALTLDAVTWLVEGRPETTIVCTGWEGRVVPDRQIVDVLHGYDVRVMKTGDGLALYNRLLLQENRRVAIHVHSTD